MPRTFYSILLFAIAFFYCASPAAAQSPCDSVQVSHNPNPPLYYSPDSSMYLVNVQDTDGVYQIYVANAGDTNLTCISLNYPWSFLRPWSVRNKLQVQWSPHGDFIICAVEKEFYNELLYVPYSLRLGLLASGIWMDIFAVTPDGSNWYNLATTQHGFTGPAFTPDGLQCAWAEALDSSNLAVDVFGNWKLRLSDFTTASGVPSFASTTDITPAGARWVEPGNFSPDGVSLLISSDIGIVNAEGQDQYIINIANGQVTNLTNSPMIWDEHGVFSPDGTKILFMTSYPYQADTNSYHTISIKAEFMLMDVNGSNLQQLTHYCDTGYVESSPGIAATGYWGRGDSTIYAQSLIFPDYDNWKIKFAGDCGYTVTGVTEWAADKKLHVYPNPIQDVLTIETTFNLRDASVRILDVMGRQVKVMEGMEGNKMFVNLQALPPGIYFVEVKAGDAVWMERVVRVN